MFNPKSLCGLHFFKAKRYSADLKCCRETCGSKPASIVALDTNDLFGFHVLLTFLVDKLQLTITVQRSVRPTKMIDNLTKERYASEKIYRKTTDWDNLTQWVSRDS